MALRNDAAPDRHHGVADELIERAVVLEDGVDHFSEVFVELRNQLGLVRAFRHRGKIAHIREQNRHRPPHPSQGIEIGLGIVEQLLHDVFGNIPFQGPPHPPLLHSFEDKIVDEAEEAAGVEREERGHGQDHQVGLVVEKQGGPAVARRHHQHGGQAEERAASDEVKGEGEGSGEEDQDHVLREGGLTQEFPVERGSHEVKMKLRSRHLRARQSERRGMFILEKVRGRAYQNDFVPEKFSVLIVIFPVVGKKNGVERKRPVAKARGTSVSEEPRLRSRWNGVRPAKLAQGTGRERFNHCPRPKEASAFFSPQAIARAAVDPVSLLRPHIDKPDPIVFHHRAGSGLGHECPAGRRQTQHDRPAITRHFGEIYRDHHSVPVFLQHLPQGVVARGRGGKKQVDGDHFGPGLHQPLNQRGPNLARPGKSFAHLFQHRGLLEIVLAQEVLVAVLVDADENQTGINGSFSAVADAQVMGVILQSEQRQNSARVEPDKEAGAGRAEGGQD